MSVLYYFSLFRKNAVHECKSGLLAVKKMAHRPFLRSTQDVNTTTEHACCALLRLGKPISALLCAFK